MGIPVTREGLEAAEHQEQILDAARPQAGRHYSVENARKMAERLRRAREAYVPEFELNQREAA